jgi:hypothetical protein
MLTALKSGSKVPLVIQSIAVDYGQVLLKFANSAKLSARLQSATRYNL